MFVEALLCAWHTSVNRQTLQFLWEALTNRGIQATIHISKLDVEYIRSWQCLEDWTVSREGTGRSLWLWKSVSVPFEEKVEGGRTQSNDMWKEMKFLSRGKKQEQGTHLVGLCLSLGNQKMKSRKTKNQNCRALVSSCEILAFVGMKWGTVQGVDGGCLGLNGITLSAWRKTAAKGMAWHRVRHEASGRLWTQSHCDGLAWHRRKSSVSFCLKWLNGGYTFWWQREWN